LCYFQYGTNIVSGKQLKLDGKTTIVSNDKVLLKT